MQGEERIDSADRALVQIVDAALAGAVRVSGTRLACRPGCSDCCMGAFPITQLDARRLASGLAEMQASDPARAAAVHRASSARLPRGRRRCPLWGTEARGLPPLHRRASRSTLRASRSGGRPSVAGYWFHRCRGTPTSLHTTWTVALREGALWPTARSKNHFPEQTMAFAVPVAPEARLGGEDPGGWPWRAAAGPGPGRSYATRHWSVMNFGPPLVK